MAVVLEKLKKEGIHTCIDTSGSVVINDQMKKLIDLTQDEIKKFSIY